MKTHRKFVAQGRFLTVNELEESLASDEQSEGPAMIVVNRDAKDQPARSAGEELHAGRPSYTSDPAGRTNGYPRRTSVPRFISEDLEIDFQRRRVVAQGRLVRLTPYEFDLLRYLVEEKGHPLEHSYLLERVWGRKHPREIESLRVLINQLRKKIEPDPAHPTYIHTDSRIGYRFEPEWFPSGHRKSRTALQRGD